MKRLLFMALALALVLVVGITGAVSAAAVTPVLVDPWSSGNAESEAAQVGTYMYSYKIDPAANGTYVAEFDDGHINYITISNSDGTYFDWSATCPIGAVIVKAGRTANVFYYDPQAYSDTGLCGPTNLKNGQPYGLGHITFCWNPEEVEYEYETAFAYGGDYATCFLDEGFSRWGWSNGPLVEGEYTFKLWAAAGQCDTSNGILVGSVDIVYADGSVTVNFNVDAPYILDETHVYAGSSMFPLKNGDPTVAPGQYYVEDPLLADIYVIAHSMVGIPI